MRITENMMTETMLRNLNVNTERLEALQDQLTSGKRIRKPSDDPPAVALALGFRAELDKTKQYVKNIDAASSWLGTTDSSLDALSSLLLRARELAVAGANDTLSAEDRQAMANEVAQLLDQAVVIGNSTYGDQYIFAGQKTTTPPFTLVAGPPEHVNYDGDSGAIVREIGANAVLSINTTGDTVFPTAFKALIGLKNALEASDSDAVDASLSDVQQACNSVLAERAKVGAKVNRLEVAQSRLEDIRINIAELLSKQEDVDMAEAVTHFSVAESVYKAALAAGSRAVQPSLLDYLR